MFKWRSHERNRITAVFKLQFHVTQVAEYRGNGLVISVVPAENGRPTAKLEKCVIKEDNNCYWEIPVYETVKFIQDPKSGKILDRIYYFLISTGSSKGSQVGEFCVNIAEYIGATKPCSVSFPFKNSNSDSHLHVSIQRIQENNNQRELEVEEGLKNKPDDRSLRRHFSNGDLEEEIKTDPIEDQPLRKTTSQPAVLNGTRRGSSGSDITLSSSDSSSGLNTPRELAVRNNTTNGDLASNGLGYQDQPRSQWELAIVPVNDSNSVYSMNSPRDVFPSDRSQMGLDDSAERLKADLVALSRKAEVSELELQTLRKQIVKESKKGQDLLREITGLKAEKNALKDECEKLKASRKRTDEFKTKSKFQFEGDPWMLLEEIREELNYEKDLNANLRIQLQKTQESNAELLFAVQDLEEILEKNDRGVSHLPNRLTSGESTVETERSKCQSDDEEQKALEELVRQHSDAQETYLLEQKIMDLCSEIEMYRRDKDELEMQMEQLALDYEILKQENHEFSSRLEQSHLQEQLKMHCEGSNSYAALRELEAQREKLEIEVKEKSEELSDCLATIKNLEARSRSLAKELQKQAEGFEAEIQAITHAKMEQEQRAAQAEEARTQSDAIINELESKITELSNEQKKYLEKLAESLGTIKELETHNHDLEDELEMQGKRFKAEMEALVHAKTGQEHRAMQAEEAIACSNATIDELEDHIKNLEGELKKHSEESSGTLVTVKELEAYIQNLEEEMERQAGGFEADLEAVTHAKVEQEKRAIRAEEALKLMRWKNANTAARIQDEFKRLSTQMQSSFEANEKLASKALTEASELRMQNRHLKDLLQRANDDLQLAKHDYETKLHDLHNRISMQSTQIEQMAAEIDEKSILAENQNNQHDESASCQQLDLRAEIERLNIENKSLSEQQMQEKKLRSELEHMKALVKERDQLLERENIERNNLEGTIASLKEVGGKSLEEVNVLRYVKDEKEQLVKNLQSEVEELRAQCDNLKNALYEDESEKEKLRKQVFQLKGDIKKKDEAISSIQKKFKENGDKSIATSKNTKSEQTQRGHKEVGSKEVTTLKERIKLLEGQIKSKETAMETSANAFLAKEKALHCKIENLETRLGEADLNPSITHDKKVKEEKVSVGTQVVCDAEEAASAGYKPEEASVTDENSNIELDSNEQVSSDNQPSSSDDNSGERKKFDILLKEMVILKERNESMEIELLEMQERYSEISLRFAEVEGERQQLVMRLRNIKNAKKS